MSGWLVGRVRENMVSDSRGRILSDKESQTDAVQKIQKDA